MQIVIQQVFVGSEVLTDAANVDSLRTPLRPQLQEYICLSLNVSVLRLPSSSFCTAFPHLLVSTVSAPSSPSPALQLPSLCEDWVFTYPTAAWPKASFPSQEGPFVLLFLEISPSPISTPEIHCPSSPLLPLTGKLDNDPLFLFMAH